MYTLSIKTLCSQIQDNYFVYQNDMKPSAGIILPNLFTRVKSPRGSSQTPLFSVVTNGI